MNLWKLICQHRNVKINYFKPREAKILVFDVECLELLTPLLAEAPYEILYVRGELLYISPSILGATLVNWMRMGRLSVAYNLALIQCVRPSIVVTCTDNRRLFWRVQQHYAGARFLAVQNGNRHDVFEHPDMMREIYLSEFACFGQHEIDKYTEYGAKIGKFYPIGSLKDAYYQETYGNEVKEEKFDLCLVSEAEGIEAFPEIEKSYKKLVTYLAKFCDKNKKTLCISAKNDVNKSVGAKQGFLNELQWHRKHMGEGVKVFSNGPKFNTYKRIDSSEVSLAFCSTALVEAFGRGRRTLFCNFSDSDYYGLPVKGLWTLGDCSYEEFEERLLVMLAMTDEEFQKISSGAASYVMNYHKDNPAHKFLRALIADAVRA